MGELHLMKKILLGIAAILVLVLVGCGNQESGTNSKRTNQDGEKELIIASVREPDTLDVQSTTWVDDTNGHLFDKLFNFDFEGNLIPGLVEEYEISEDSKVGTFHLKEDAKFHSGEPVTAEATIQSLERFLEISPVFDILGSVEDMTAVDEHTVQITWTEPYAPFFPGATTAYMGVIDTSVLDDAGEGFEQNPVASGPLKHVETKRGESITYEPFEDYDWGAEGAPDFDKVTFRFISDDDTRLLEFKNGTVHILANVPPQYLKELEEDSEVTLEKVLENGNTYLGFNMKRPIFEDKRVRQAIAKGIDRDPIIDHALDGMAQPAYSALPKTVFGFSQTVEDMAAEKYARDVEGAKQLLAEAGWDETNSDGIAMKDGQPFTIELWMTDEPVMQRIGQIIQNQLKEIGIDIKLVVQEDAAIRAQTPEGAHEMILWRYGWPDADILYSLFGEGMSTRMHYEPAELNDLLLEARAEVDIDQRLALYEEAQEFLVEESPWVPLFVRESVTASRGLENFKKHPIQDTFIWPGMGFGN